MYDKGGGVLHTHRTPPLIRNLSIISNKAFIYHKILHNRNSNRVKIVYLRNFKFNSFILTFGVKIKAYLQRLLTNSLNSNNKII